MTKRTLYLNTKRHQRNHKRHQKLVVFKCTVLFVIHFFHLFLYIKFSLLVCAYFIIYFSFYLHVYIYIYIYTEYIYIYIRNIYIYITEFSGRGFRSHSGQVSIATSKNPSVVNTICVNSFLIPLLT